MKRRRNFTFLALLVLLVGAFFVLPNQKAKAQGGSHCMIVGNFCRSDCDDAYNDPNNPAYHNAAVLARCKSTCTANQYACYSANAWQSWLIEFNGNIGENFLILNEPSPYCAYYPDELVYCGSLPTSEEIEACVMMVQFEQAKFNCP